MFKSLSKYVPSGLLLTALLFPQAALATSSMIVVKQADLATDFAQVMSNPGKWLFYNDENDTIDSSLGSFVNGPATAPLSSGSAQITVTGTERKNLSTYQFSGKPLSTISVMKYSTYNPSAGNGGSTNRSGFLFFNVDFNGTDTWQRRLVYVPSSNGTVLQNTWQEWDAISSGNAKWVYSGATWPVTGQAGTTEKTWNQILTDYPSARIRVTDSQLGIRVGEPYANGYTENIDAFKFTETTHSKTFDFEVDDAVAPPVPTHLSPANNSFSTTANFAKAEWTAVSDPSSPVTYMYESASLSDTNPDGSFVTPIFTSGSLNNAEIPTAGTPEGVYYWHVRSVDSLGNQSAWSTSWKITVDNTAPKVNFLGLRDQTSSTYDNTKAIRSCGWFNDTGFIAWEWKLKSGEVSPVSYLYRIKNGPTAVNYTATTTDTHYNGQIPLVGTYVVQVTATDAAGNVGKTDTCSVSYKPPAPIVGPPTTKQECKYNGWKKFNNPIFENQGQCVSYVNAN